MATVYDIDVEKHYVHPSLNDVFMNWVFFQTLVRVLLYIYLKYSGRKMVPKFPSKSIIKQSSHYKNDCWQIICICPILFYFQHEREYYFQCVCVCVRLCVRACVLYIKPVFVCQMICFSLSYIYCLVLEKVCLFNRNICSTHLVLKTVF